MSQNGGVPGPDPLLDRPDWAPSWVPSIDDVRQVRYLRWALVAVFVAGLTSCVVRGADGPADPRLGVASGPSQLAATFGTVLVEIATASGEVVALCLLHADRPEERTRGLAGATDLEGFDGVLFANDDPVETEFANVDTVMALTITWWRDDGSFVAQADMEPCLSPDPDACPRYPPGGAYQWAIEAPRGELAARGVDPAAVLVVGTESCTPA